MTQPRTFYEFFAGGGMARAGLGPGWQCLFANDISPKKAEAYARNWGHNHLVIGDIAQLQPDDLPGQADLAWASFPCQDLSLAGPGAGLKGQRSGAFWPFWHLIRGLHRQHRAPRLIVLENVLGTLSSHNGADYATIGSALTSANYHFGALVIDAIHFIPQSRPRLFILAVQRSLPIPTTLQANGPQDPWHPPILIEATRKLSPAAQLAWQWWSLPRPPARTQTLADVIEDTPQGVPWHPANETRRLLDMMTPTHRQKVEIARMSNQRRIGTIYKRTRLDPATGHKIQRAEIRMDNVAGCLRTPIGGSSRQTIMVIEGGHIRSRLLSPREAARLMGLPDDYVLPDIYNEAYHLAGDGVVVPVVRYLAQHLLEPLLAQISIPTLHPPAAACPIS